MRRVIIAIMAALMIMALAVPALAVSENTPVGFGLLFYEDETVRTVVPPAAAPQEGRDNLYVIMEGAEGQLPVAAVAPGDRDYHGGQWAFHSVTWNTMPYLLGSEGDVEEAATAGDVTITRVAANDFKCPIQPGGGRR